MIEKAIDDSTTLDNIEQWEFVKSRAIDKCRILAKNKATHKRNMQASLCKTLDILNKDLQELHDNTEQHKKQILEAIKHIEFEIDQMRQEKVNGCIFRSKVNWELHGEKPTKYFFGLEKRNYFSKNMRAV